MPARIRPVWPVLFPLAPLLAMSGTALAGPDETVGFDLSQDAAPPAGVDTTTAPPRASRQGPKVIFLNFDGAQISSGNSDDARNNISRIRECTGTVQPYRGGAREAIIQAVKKDWERFDVNVVFERPQSGNYTMAMIGDANCQGSFYGYAPVDCFDRNLNSIVYSFDRSNSSIIEATVVSQEVAHSYGLEHVDNRNEIMNPAATGDQAFYDQCYPITGNRYCGAQHAEQCGSENQQNSVGELESILGTAIPDTGPPTVSIESPSNGDVLAEGSDFVVTVLASDDRGIMRVNLRVDGADVGADETSPYRWDVANIPAGTYTFEAVATDTAGQSATSAPVTVTVTDEPDDVPDDPGDPSGGDGDGDDPSGGGDGDGESGGSSGGDGEGSGGGETDGFPPDGDDSGGASGGPDFDPWGGDGSERGGCRIDGEPGGIGGLALMITVVGFRRRRI